LTLRNRHPTVVSERRGEAGHRAQALDAQGIRRARRARPPDEGRRIELLDGLLVVAEPQSAYHYAAIGLVVRALTRAFGEGWTVRAQGPLALDETSEPEPDVAVVRGDMLEYAWAHPTDPVLVVEVTLSSGTLDRRYKSSLYARARRQDYWLLDLTSRRLEVRRDPVPAESAPYGWEYADVQVLAAADRVRPLAAPGVSIPVADVLPPAERQ
jgi:Uma2 family endonuclease